MRQEVGLMAQGKEEVFSINEKKFGRNLKRGLQEKSNRILR